jgi:hypothetical protein
MTREKHSANYDLRLRCGNLFNARRLSHLAIRLHSLPSKQITIYRLNKYGAWWQYSRVITARSRRLNSPFRPDFVAIQETTLDVMSATTGFLHDYYREVA